MAGTALLPFSVDYLSPDRRILRRKRGCAGRGAHRAYGTVQPY